jgi:hypothetical protein
MQADTQAHVSFFLTGRRSSEHLDAVDGLGLRPALFAGYRELNQLRYDFPVVLIDGSADAEFAQPLSGLIDNALASAARGSDADRVRKHAIRIEQEIRTLAAGTAVGSFAALWDTAVSRLGKTADKSFDDSAQRVRSAIKLKGSVADCDAALPTRLLQHAWAAVQRQKAETFRKDLDRLVLKLSDILKADYERSDAGRSAKNLQAAVGTGFGETFDFSAMSRLLAKALPKDVFPENRRKRIGELLVTLNAQQFIPASGAPTGKAGSAKPYAFLFSSCVEALSAYRQRGPKLIELAKAIAIAELEINGQYSEARHDDLFAHFGKNGLDAQDLAQFPDYLVCINAEKMDAVEHAQLMEILSSGLPIKVLLQIDDILEQSAHGEGSLTTGMASRQIATMAIGLNEAYVLQSSSSNLLRFRERMLRGLNYSGPALFSVFSGASAKASGLPGLQLRPFSRSELGVALLPRCQCPSRSGLAGAELHL